MTISCFKRCSVYFLIIRKEYSPLTKHENVNVKQHKNQPEKLI